jgi:hypothetical protein
MSEEIEKEVLDQDTTPDEDNYDAEYEKAWGDEGIAKEVEGDLEQPEAEPETSDEIVDEEVVEDSKPEDKPSEDFAEVLKWKGKELPVTKEELIALAQKGFDAEKKWQDVATIRPYNELIKNSGLSVEELQMLADAKSGKSEALALMAERYGIDLYDAEKRDYTPSVANTNY